MHLEPYELDYRDKLEGELDADKLAVNATLLRKLRHWASTHQGHWYINQSTLMQAIRAVAQSQETEWHLGKKARHSPRRRHHRFER